MNTVKRSAVKREVDLQTLSDWIAPRSRVLDLGCGRGILLEHLKRKKEAYGVGIDSDPGKITSCVKRDVSAYQGDIGQMLREYPDQFFDWVVCSRTLHELSQPSEVIQDALRVGKRVAVGFVNNGFWLNRWSMLRSGRRVHNEVYPETWESSRAFNPVSVGAFEAFCEREAIRINRKVFLGADWRTPCQFWPDLMAGYALYEIGTSPEAKAS